MSHFSVSKYAKEENVKLEGCIPLSSLGDRTYLLYARRSSAASQAMDGRLAWQSLRFSLLSTPSGLKYFCGFVRVLLSQASAPLLPVYYSVSQSSVVTCYLQFDLLKSSNPIVMRRLFMMDWAEAQPPELLPELLLVAHFDANDESSKDRQESRAADALLTPRRRRNCRTNLAVMF